jgi:phosphomannomutase/phosphoglucomutase
MDSPRYKLLQPVPVTIFRAYDIRGIVEQQLDQHLIYHLGLAVGTQIRRLGEQRVVVGADGRLSSPSLGQALIEGLSDSGCSVINLGAVPTPVLYFGIKVLDANSGIMLTGSHNPANYNGCKIVLGGKTLANEAIQSLYQTIVSQDYELGNGTVESMNILSRYCQRICSDLQLARPLKVVIDCGNGIAGVIAPALFTELGCEVIPLYCEVDGNFPNHHPDPSKVENLVNLQVTVAQHQADLGLAFDGDGDRVGVITEQSQILLPDKLLMLFAEDVISRNPGAEIIYDVKCTRLLDSVIRKQGGIPTMYKTGHSLIKNKMLATGALLGGEMSGHIFFQERWYGFDDGLYSAARLCEILAAQTQPASLVFNRFPEDISTPEINISVSDITKFDLVRRLQLGDYGNGRTSTIDGIRVDFDDGWGLVRASNTTSMLVLRFEGTDQAALQRIKALFQTQLYIVDPNLHIPD